MKINYVDSSIEAFERMNLDYGLNLILGDRAKGNVSTSGHNVGKTTIIKIIEYVLFHKKDKSYFDGWLQYFENEEFKIQICENDGKILNLSVPIIKRLNKNEISIDISDKYPDISYFIRYRTEYDNEFTRPNFKGKHINWKPLVFSILGFNSVIMRDKMQNDIDLNNTSNVIKAIETANIKDKDKTERINELEEESRAINESMKKLDFFHYDKELIINRLNKITNQYHEIKHDLYELELNKSASIASLENQKDQTFNINEIDQIFKETDLLLKDGVIKTYQELVDFNKSLTSSRKEMLEEVIDELTIQIEQKTNFLEKISATKSKYTNILAKKDFKETYDEFQERLISIEKEISVLSVSVLKQSKEEFEDQKNKLEVAVAKSSISLRKEKNSDNETFKRIQFFYNYLLKKILRVNGIIEIIENKNGNLDFRTAIKDSDSDLLGLNGEAFRKISCGVFDLSVAAASPEKGFFLIHDGIIDGIAEPIKRKYLVISHIFSKMKGFQYIVTGINEGIPQSIANRCIVKKMSDNTPQELLLGRNY